MKNKVLCKVTMGLMILLSTVNVGLAGDSFSIPVSCSIPAVPGLNAPLIEGEIVETEMDRIVEETGQDKEKAQKEESPSMIQEDSEEATRLVKTIYSR